jgi:long-chain fatty acid transport protein
MTGLLLNTARGGVSMSFNKSKLAIAVAALAFSSGAFATNGILQAGNGMVAHGLGGAGLSNAGEASAGMDNPALITQTGDALNVAWSMFMPDRKTDTTGMQGMPPGWTGEVVSDSKMFGIPQVAFTSKINDKMSWGIMAYALGGMNTDYRTGVLGTFDPNTGLPVDPLAATNPESVNLQGMIVAPTFSYAFSKDFSAGASLIIGYETLTTRNLFGAGAFGTNEGSATGFGVKLGADWKLSDGVSLGAVLQPKLSMDEISYFKTFLNGAFGYTGNVALTLPTEAGIGGKFALGKDMDIVADIMYYQWSGVDVFKFFGWDDQIVYKVGAEFRTSDKLALRVGFNYGESPIKGGNPTGPIPNYGNTTADAAYANYPFPAISETHFTLGLGYKMDKNATFNMYYLYAPEVSQTATTTSFGQLPPGTKLSMSQNAFGLGLNYAVK